MAIPIKDLRELRRGGESFVITPRKREISDSEVERRVFTSLGLTEQEWDVYTFLCKARPLKAIDIARNLGTNRVLIYDPTKGYRTKHTLGFDPTTPLENMEYTAKAYLETVKIPLQA